MLYLGTASGPKVRAETDRGEYLGFLVTVKSGPPRPRWAWAVDNRCFVDAAGFDLDQFRRLLTRLAPRAGRCRFVAAPDVVGDAAATLDRSAPVLAEIRRLGYPAALVAQDGLERHAVPWAALDALFVGGSTEWKLGAASRALMAEAKARGKHVHVGRVNTRGRLFAAYHAGADTIDGTCLRWPDANLAPLLRWLREAHHPTLDLTA